MYISNKQKNQKTQQKKLKMFCEFNRDFTSEFD